jgi:hypothetical protein
MSSSSKKRTDRHQSAANMHLSIRIALGPVEIDNGLICHMQRLHGVTGNRIDAIRTSLCPIRDSGWY